MSPYWNKPLNFEKLKVEVPDDKSGKKVVQEFSVLLTIDDEMLSNTKGKLLVREEYLQALAALQSYFDRFPNKGAIVLGHPGIGKSLLIFFLLARRLSERRKTILNIDPNSDVYLFHESGLYLFTGTLTDHLKMDTITLGKDTWALLDSPSQATIPNPILTAAHAPVFVVFCSSPNRSRYKHLLKQNNALPNVMDNWSFGEIWAGAMLHRQSNDDEQSNDSEQDRLHGYFWKYGPSARTLFSLYNGGTTPATLDDVINHALCRQWIRWKPLSITQQAIYKQANQPYPILSFWSIPNLGTGLSC